MLRRSYLAFAIVAVLAFTGGCGGSSHKSSSGGSSVSMQGLRFHPESMTVHVGATVVWKNDDSVDHNVTAISGASFHSRAFGQGGTYSFRAQRPGTVRYVCTLHPGMNGTLTIVR